MSPLKRNTLESQQHSLVIKLLNITYKYAPASNDTELHKSSAKVIKVMTNINLSWLELEMATRP